MRTIRIRHITYGRVFFENGKKHSDTCGQGLIFFFCVCSPFSRHKAWPLIARMYFTHATLPSYNENNKSKKFY